MPIYGRQERNESPLFRLDQPADRRSRKLSAETLGLLMVLRQVTPLGNQSDSWSDSPGTCCLRLAKSSSPSNGHSKPTTTHHSQDHNVITTSSTTNNNRSPSPAILRLKRLLPRLPPSPLRRGQVPVQLVHVAPPGRSARHPPLLLRLPRRRPRRQQDVPPRTG